MLDRESQAERNRESTTRVRILVFVVASVIVYVGVWLIGSVVGRMLLDALSQPGRTLSSYGPIIWTLCAVLIASVQVGALRACGVRSARSLVLRTLASVALTAVLLFLLELLAMFLSTDMVSLSFRIVSAAAGLLAATGIAGIAVLVSLIPQRAVEQALRADAQKSS